jgi:hypothetical protein
MQFWAPVVYALCLLASATCAWLLVRSFRRNRTPLLLWSAACFVLLALNHLLVVIDLIVLPADVDLQLVRSLTLVAAVLTLLYGFIWEVD